MSVIQSCSDTKDIVELFRPQGLYLKPIARINVSVQLPQLRKSGSKISNWEVMEKVKEMARPFNFPVFKVSKSSLDFIRFEAEIENYGSMENVLAKLDMRTIKLSGFTELLKIRAAEAKGSFPTRADWDEFFRDNKDMNEMHAGERPDTIVLDNLPCKWFLQMQNKSGEVPDKPSEFVLKKTFSAFGDVRMVDIPMLDPYRHKMTSSVSGIRTFSFGEDLVFQGYVQYKEYIGFVKCMNALKGMKLCYKDRDTTKAWTSNIKVDFDKSKHLAESTIKKRKEEREKLVKEEVEKLEEEKKKAKLEQLKKNEQIKLLEAEEKDNEEKRAAKKLVAEQRRLAREERRKNRRLKKIGLTEEEEMAYRIGAEERKLILAQRKLESIRILDELISRVKGIGKLQTGSKAKAAASAGEKEKKSKKKAESDSESEDEEEDGSELKEKEKEYRDKLVVKLKKKGDTNSKKNIIRKTKNQGFESVSEDDSENSRKKLKLEKISDDDLSEVGSDEELEDSSIDSEAEALRLTSTDDSESEPEHKKHKKRKKEKKEKKKKVKKEKEREREKERARERSRSRDDRRSRDRDRYDRDSGRTKRELDRQIEMAKRIAKKRSPERAERKADLWEHEKYDRDRSGRERERERERTPTGYYGIKDYFERRRQDSDDDADWIDDREKDRRQRKEFVSAAKNKRVNQFLRQQGMRKEEVEREMERAYEQYFSSLARKEQPRGVPALPRASNYDKEKEEEWERMMNPHLFEQERRGYRRPVLNQHYEDHQKEQLQAEIRIRERRERERGGRRSRSRSGDGRRRGGGGRDRSRERRRDRY